MILINFVSILLALLLFGFLIFIHEFGHYIMARIFNVRILEFSIGMGPKLFSRTSKKTKIAYSLRALPIGGFVAMDGEDTESEDENAFYKKPVWQRILVTAAGAFMNFLVGVLVMGILVSTQKVLPSNVIGEFAYDENGVCYAESAGFELGDEITSVGGTRVHIANETIYEIMRRGIDPLDVTVRRNGEEVTLEDVTFQTLTDSGIRYGMIDFKVLPETRTVGVVIKHAFYRSVSNIKMIWESLYDLLRGRYGLEAVSGPIGVTKALGEAAREGTADFVNLGVIISLNLGVTNLLPLPALDGGRLLFQFIELIRRKPVKREIEGYVHFAGLVLLLLLMAVVAVKDIVSLI